MRPVKTYDYIVVLKQPRSYRFIDVISQLMLTLAIIAFIYEGFILSKFQTDHFNIRGLFFVFPSLIIIWLLWCNHQRKKGLVPYYRFALMVAAWGWYLYPKGLPFVIIYLVAAILEKPVKVYPEIAFDQNEIVFNSFPQRKIAWQNVTNVIMKDGLLTIDLKNNKLIQKEVDDDVLPKDENDFNGFCQAMLKSTGS